VYKNASAIGVTMNPIATTLSWKYQKNKHLVETFFCRNAPEFIYKSHPPSMEREIPVFMFHMALPDWFEEQCLHLAENGYNTLSADEFLYVLSVSGRSPKQSVLLTFDDGLKHLWTVAYPLLKKYNLKATCFLIPGCIPENDRRIRPTLEDYWKGNASVKEIVNLNSDGPPLCTWEEIRIMHESGVIDFQSHSMYHSLVFTSDKIFDFIHPRYNRHFFGNIHIPVYASRGKDVFSRDPVLGMPIYFGQPRMSARRRFFDDEKIRDRCVEIARNEGGEEFFTRRNWRRILRKAVSDYRKTKTVTERYETPEERDKVILEELLASKNMIEEKLSGKEVRHLCYPWYEGGRFAVRASNMAGFKANYFGKIRGRPTNRPGDDPFGVVRVDNIYLERLPGKRRKKIRDIFRKLYELKNTPEKLGVAKKGNKQSWLRFDR